MAKSAKRATKKATKKAGGRSAKSAKSARKSSAKKTKAVKKSAKKKSGAKKKRSGRTPNAAFMAPVTPSATLAVVVGSKPIPRTEVTKRLWAYIKKNDLQDAMNRRTINADANLRPIFGGRSSVNMFEMTRLVGKHLA